jgi:hypothetical protein
MVQPWWALFPLEHDYEAGASRARRAFPPCILKKLAEASFLENWKFISYVKLTPTQLSTT